MTASPRAWCTRCSRGKPIDVAVEYGAAHGALAMTTPGDTSMVSLDEVEAAMRARTVRAVR